ncbi:MAG TPA: hypothetical protein VMU94_28575 [Streptosporangiaceae bacterium]|nr:hypothetical protein [Streptosporangiaceae bacterium]
MTADQPSPLRLIRVRSTTGRETPQWWGNSPPGGVNGGRCPWWIRAASAVTCSRTGSGEIGAVARIA